MKLLHLLMIIASLALFSSSSVNAKSVNLCNASPVKIYFSIGLEIAPNDIRTHGWYHIDPGQCRSWNTMGNNFYYYGEASEKLAKWLNDDNPLSWSGWFNRNCIHPTNKFHNWQGDADCRHKVSFNRFRLSTESSVINVQEKTHKGIALKDAPEHRRKLLGRMKFENILKASSWREAPFSIGVDIEDAPDNGGVEIISAYPGMPAEHLALVKGDKIVSLNGSRVQNMNDMHSIFVNLSLFGHDPIPLSIISVYDGKKYDGLVEPVFFPFNHRDYREENKAAAFGGSFIDGAFFSLSSELFCGVESSFWEGLRSLQQDDDFNTKSVLSDATVCANVRDRELAKDALLYADAANAGSWASLIVPGIPIAKLAKLGKAIPLAAKSRKVSRAASTPKLKR